MWKVLALLPCLLLIAEVKGTCRQLLACENEVTESSFFSSETSLVGYADEADVLDTICTELGGLTSCISSTLDSCSDTTVKNQIKAVKDIIQYMCSPDGRQVVLSLADSDCSDNAMIEVHMELMMQACLEDFQLELQMEQLNAMFEGREFQMHDVCPFVDGLETCLVNGSADMCGSAMGTFMTNIWHIASADQFAQFGCTHDTVHKRRAIRRAIPMLLKRTSLLRKLRK